MYNNSFNPSISSPSSQNLKIINKKEVDLLNKLSSKSASFSSISSNNYKSFFNFDIEEIYFFINEDEVILNVSQNFENEQLCKITQKIYLNIIKSTNKIKNTDNSIQFNNFYMNKFKLSLLSFKDIYVTVLCLFDIRIKNSVIRFFMIYLLISFLNFIQKNSDICQTDAIDKILYSKIYESFMLLPLIRYFYLLSENIFNKHSIFLDKMLYNNFYLVNLDENNTKIFSFNNLHNLPKVKKRYKNKILWDELLFHSNNLKKNYLSKLGKISDKEYQNYFVKIEYKATYPYLIFVIRFLPILNGIALIHEYETKKRNNHLTINKNEFDIIYGDDVFSDIDLSKERCINEPKIIKERESFIYGFLSTSLPYENFFYESKLSVYYSEEILNLINKIVEKSDENSLLNINLLLKNILDSLYNEYLKDLDQNNNMQENKLKNRDDIIKRNIKLKDKINEDKNEIVNNKQWNYSNYYHNQNLFKMKKIYYLLTLFKPTANISRFTNNIINLDDDNKKNDNDKYNKYEYINIDLKKGLHKSISLSMKFSSDGKKNIINNSPDNISDLNISDSINNLLTQLSNYDGPTNIDQSTNNITSEYNKTISEEDTFCSLKKSIFELKSFSINNKNDK